MKHDIRPVFPQSEVLVKFVQETGEKCSENLAKNFADFCPSISMESVRKKFHEKSSTFSTLHQIKFFHCCNSGRWGPQHLLSLFPVFFNLSGIVVLNLPLCEDLRQPPPLPRRNPFETTRGGPHTFCTPLGEKFLKMLLDTDF